MKIVYQLTLFLFVCGGLASCGANSMFEAETMESDAMEVSRGADEASIPAGCVSWFDGCNSCTVKDGQISACTKKACKAQSAEPACQSFAPGFSDSAQVEAEDSSVPETIPETKRAAGADVPENCKIWFDGCNSCVVLGGRLRGCTSKVCASPGPASCTKE